VTPEEFREVMGRFATGVTIVTIEDEDGKPYGLTVNSFTSVSMNPPLVLVCLDNRLSGLANFKESDRFGVNILAEGQADLSDYFAQAGTDRSQGHYVKGETGVPLLEGVLARMECRIVSLYPGGDHTIVLGEVKGSEVLQPDKGPLLYHGGRYRRL
jgi:flavin reductase (DIM6/NTAB) family NADH-FMN oxidoreductase RutF